MKCTLNFRVEYYLECFWKLTHLPTYVHTQTLFNLLCLTDLPTDLPTGSKKYYNNQRPYGGKWAILRMKEFKTVKHYDNFKIILY